MDKMHKIQLNILRRLLFSVSSRYSDIKPFDMEGSLFKYHLDKLINRKLVRKDDSGLYFLTHEGKEFANQMDSIKISMGKQAKTTAKICCVRNIDQEIEYLLYTRKKNPFYSFQGFATSKIWYGESFDEGAKRGLYDETNLIGNPKLIAIRHYIVCDILNQELLEDKVMYIYKFINPIGDLCSKKDGEFAWVKESDIEKFVLNPLPEFPEILELLKVKRLTNFSKRLYMLLILINFN